MKSENPLKHVVIKIDFRHMRDFSTTMTKIKRMVKNGVQESSEKHDHFNFDHSMTYLKEFDYSIEEIDGKLCMIIPSKMNGKPKRERPPNLGGFRETVTFTTDFEKIHA